MKCIQFSKQNNGIDLIKKIIKTSLELKTPIVYRFQNDKNYYFDTGENPPGYPHCYPLLFSSETDTIKALRLISSSQYSIRIDHMVDNQQLFIYIDNHFVWQKNVAEKRNINFLENVDKINHFKILQKHLKVNLMLNTASFVSQVKWLDQIHEYTPDYPINHDFFNELYNHCKIIENKKGNIKMSRGPFDIHSIYSYIWEPDKTPNVLKMNLGVNFFKQRSGPWLLHNNTPPHILSFMSFIIDKNNLYKRNKLRMTKQMIKEV